MTALQWDTVATDGFVTGGAGVWSASSLSWTANGGTTNTVFGAGDSATFGGVGGTISLSTSFTASGLGFTASGYILTGGAITVAATGLAISIANALHSVVFNSEFSGTGNLSLSGGGTATFQHSSIVTMSIIGGAVAHLTAGWGAAIANAGTLVSGSMLTATLTNRGVATLSGQAASITNLAGGALTVALSGLILAPSSMVANTVLPGSSGAAMISLSGDLSGFDQLTNAGQSAGAAAQVQINTGASLTGAQIQNGGWGYLINQGVIDAQISNLAGASFSTYSGASVIGDVSNAGSLTLYGDLIGSLTTSGTTTFALGAAISGSVSQSAGSFSVLYGGLSVSGDLAILGGSANFQAALSIGGTLTLGSGTMTGNGSLITADMVEIGALVTFANGLVLDTANLTLGSGATAASLTASSMDMAALDLLTLHAGNGWIDSLSSSGSIDLGQTALHIIAAAGSTGGQIVTAALGGLSVNLTGVTLSGPLQGWLAAIDATNSHLTLDMTSGALMLDLSAGATAAHIDFSADLVTLTGGGFSQTQTSLAGGLSGLIGTGFDDVIDAGLALTTLTLVGGAGDDLITGGMAADMLTGGAGADVFVFSVGAEFGDDTITDFDPTQDSIRLGLDSVTYDQVWINTANGVSSSVRCLDPFGDNQSQSLSVYVRQSAAGAVLFITSVDSAGLATTGQIMLSGVLATELFPNDIVLL